MRNLNTFIIERLKLTKDSKLFKEFAELAQKTVNYVWPITDDCDSDDIKGYHTYVKELTNIFEKYGITEISKPMYGGAEELNDALCGLYIDRNVAKKYGFKMSDYKEASIQGIQFYTKINLDDLSNEDNDNYILLNDDNLCYTIYGDFSGKKKLIIFYNSMADYAFIFYVK